MNATTRQQSIGNALKIRGHRFQEETESLIERSQELLADISQLPATEQLNLLAQIQLAIAARMARACAEVSR